MWQNHRLITIILHARKRFVYGMDSIACVKLSFSKYSRPHQGGGHFPRFPLSASPVNRQQRPIPNLCGYCKEGNIFYYSFGFFFSGNEFQVCYFDYFFGPRKRTDPLNYPSHFGAIVWTHQSVSVRSRAWVWRQARPRRRVPRPLLRGPSLRVR